MTLFSINPRPLHSRLRSLAGLLLWICAMHSQALEIRFDRVLLDENLRDKGVGAIKTIDQDANGFIWIGAEYGLVRYDGAQFTRYSADPGNSRALSSNYVNDLQIDRDGHMWVATDKGLHLYHPDTDNFSAPLKGRDRAGNDRVAALAVDRANRLLLARDDGVTVIESDRINFRHYPIKQLDLDNYISPQTLLVDDEGTIWLGTKGAGAASLDLTTGRYRFFRRYRHNPATIISDNITAIAQDQQGSLWFGSYNGGLSRLDPGSTGFRNYTHDPNRPDSITTNAIWDIYTDSQGTLWIATDHGGLARYKPLSDGFEYVRHQAYNANSLSSNQIRTLFEDRQGNLWIGLFPSGVNYFNRAGEQFFNYHHQPDNPHSISHSAILSFYEDHSGVLWVGTEEGLNAFNRADGTFQRYKRDLQNPRALQANPILSMMEDSAHYLWVGTWSGGVHRMDPATRQFRQYVFQEKNSGSLSNNIVWSIVKDRSGRLWLGTEGGGLNLYQPETDNFVHFKHNSNNFNSLGSDFIWTMLLDSQGQIWIGTTVGISRFNPDTRTFVNYHQGTGANFPGERVRSFMEDRQGRIWIGTQDNGFYIFDPTTEQFTHYGKETALPALYVTGFVQDLAGMVWASTTNGLVKIDPDDMSMTTFNKSHGLVGNNFNREANFLDGDGTVYFGSTDGISAFHPENLQREISNLPLVITHFRILNMPVKVGTENSPLQQAIWLTREIVLDHTHNMFSFEFSALEFRRGIDQEYAYKMEGFDQGWIYIGNERSATFTNLNPGRYTFQVKTGVNGEWRDEVAQIQVRILPAPWKTGWAYTLYFLAAAALATLLANTKIKQVQLNSEREINRELKNLNNIKDAFLANTSHELRTPLNGIIGIADNLSDHFTGKDPYVSHHLNLIASSGRRLANLINDILDYSKLANRNLDLYRIPIDMQAVTETVFALLGPLTASKSIQLINEFTSESPLVFADENRLQQILINLVGNGIKYADAGHVRVGMTCRGNIAEIYVADSGIGIAQGQQDEIFEAFSQLQSSNARQYGGTGLGLAITRQLVEQHGGRIWVESQPHQGSKFIFTMELAEHQDRQALQQQGYSVRKFSPVPSPAQIPVTDAQKLDKPRNAEDQTILVVDDDAVNRMVLIGMLKMHDYQVIEAEDGLQAVQAIKENSHINLVIMDVMMPKMSGHEACRIIRQTHSFDCLPILFLTAKKNVDEDIQECFSAGGNDYLTKPISKFDLLPRVANHLRIAGIIKKFHSERGAG